MLRPHHRKDSQFGEVRFAPHQLFDPFILIGRDVVLIQDFRCDHILSRESGMGNWEWGMGDNTDFLSHSSFPTPHSPLPIPHSPYALSLISSRNDSANERKSARPSLQPSALSEARSGWGIMPSTFPSRLVIPAILLSEPFGFDSSVIAPPASQ